MGDRWEVDGRQIGGRWEVRGGRWRKMGGRWEVDGREIGGRWWQMGVRWEVDGSQMGGRQKVDRRNLLCHGSFLNIQSYFEWFSLYYKCYQDKISLSKNRTIFHASSGYRVYSRGHGEGDKTMMFIGPIEFQTGAVKSVSGAISTYPLIILYH